MAMKGMQDSQVLSFNEQIIAEFRENEGRCGGMFEGNPMLLLTMTGARSGRQLTSPLTYHEFDGDWIVFASAGGHPSHPAWYHNVTANPQVTVEIGTESFAATAAELSGVERTQAFDAMCDAMPRFGDYTSRCRSGDPRHPPPPQHLSVADHAELGDDFAQGAIADSDVMPDASPVEGILRTKLLRCR